MASDKIEIAGTVTESLPDGMFRIEIPSGAHVLGYTAGRLRRRRARIVPGDRVAIELSAYDPGRGRIIARLD